ncbi:MAG TPA: L-2-hydroxyglutarate oxidase [Verrucomicrobiota bacterium]|nr:L-2-hydroxyglutarate oxidase [Verrucomicrobiales bacterium]HRI16379.1 L-2-hydroxyglutarate oxidase [Verrucomicrobiota bacterium]
MAASADFLVLGGGIIGLCVARELRRRYPSERVTVVEKEPHVGEHASGRNSGVLHAGFYYSADSLKARFCRDGNRALREYIQSRGLALNPCGKLVVARTAADLPQLDELQRRGEKNGVPIERVSSTEARKIEPRAKTFERALWSPTTATADPAQVIAALRVDAEREGVQVLTGTPYLKRVNERIYTGAGEIEAGYVVNCAGLYADRVALDYGFSEAYRIVPFKGLYLYSDEPAGALRTNIYPVPNLRNPFLGVHFTVTVEGHAKIGPTAIPAFWREQYEGFGRFDTAEFAEIIWRDLGLFIAAGFDFRRLAIEELRKYSRARLVKLAGELVTGVELEHYRRWGRPGIRAQLIHLRTKKLEMDFVIEGDAKSLHVLNAVSPAWTCAFPFAAYVCDRINELTR